MGRYLLSVWSEAVWLYRVRVQSGLKQVVGFVVRTVLVFALLYFLPWFGDLTGQAKEVAAAAAAVLFSFVLAFLWDLLRAPASIDAELRRQLNIIGGRLRLQDDVDAIKLLGHAIFEKGVASYHGVKGPQRGEAWRIWSEEAERYLETHFDPHAVFSFRTGHRFDTTDAEGRSLDIRWSHQLDRFAMAITHQSKAEQDQYEFRLMHPAIDQTTTAQSVPLSNAGSKFKSVESAPK